MRRRRHTVHARDPLIQAEIAQISIEKTESHWHAIIDCLQLRESLRRQCVHARMRTFVQWIWGCDSERPFVCRDQGRQFFSSDRFAKEPALPEIATHSEKHVSLLLRFNAFSCS